MDSKKKRGGPRPGAGRKPIEDKKVQLTLYIERSKIDKFGGISSIKTMLITYIDHADKQP